MSPPPPLPPTTRAGRREGADPDPGPPPAHPGGPLPTHPGPPWSHTLALAPGDLSLTFDSEMGTPPSAEWLPLQVPALQHLDSHFPKEKRSPSLGGPEHSWVQDAPSLPLGSDACPDLLSRLESALPSPHLGRQASNPAALAVPVAGGPPISPSRTAGLEPCSSCCPRGRRGRGPHT